MVICVDVRRKRRPSDYLLFVSCCPYISTRQVLGPSIISENLPFQTFQNIAIREFRDKVGGSLSQFAKEPRVSGTLSIVTYTAVGKQSRRT